jgi:hypothetical protein
MTAWLKYVFFLSQVYFFIHSSIFITQYQHYDATAEGTRFANMIVWLIYVYAKHSKAIVTVVLCFSTYTYDFILPSLIYFEFAPPPAVGDEYAMAKAAAAPYNLFVLSHINIFRNPF